MRAVTVNAPFFNGKVFELRLGNVLGLFLVALETELVSRHDEMFRIGGCMGVMALHALPLYHNLVNTPGFFRYHCLVAAKTDLVRVGGKQFTVRSCMRIVAT